MEVKVKKEVVVSDAVREISIVNQNEEFAKRLSTLLNEKHISYGEFGLMIETDKSKPYAWCKGKYLPNLTSFMKICLALNVSADFLLFGEENE